MRRLPVFSQKEVQGFADEIDARGFARIPGYIATDDLKRMQEFVTKAVTRAGNQYVDFRSVSAMTGSGLENLSQSPELLDLLHSMFHCSTGKPPLPQEPYQLLRCVAGESGRQRSYVFHYDSYIVTALVPIHIPTEGLAGDLLVYPNTRGIRTSYLQNVLDKLWLKAPLIQRLLLAGISRRWRRATRITMVPGDLYLFWGYRSIHTNEPCDPDKVRATALIHYGNPHLGQSLPMSGLAMKVRSALGSP